MHEFSMTQQIVDRVVEEAKKRNAKKVVEVQLEVGKLTFLGLDQVRFCYDLLAKDTVLEGSKLLIEHKDGVAECTKCGYRGPLNHKDDPAYHIIIPTLQCPKCGGEVEIVGGRECTIKSVKIVL